jgi:hypothetical protein
MLDLKRSNYDAFLPPTPCHKTMREDLDRIASEHDTSVASVIRAAVSLFLETNSQNMRVDQSNRESSTTQSAAK